MASDQGKNTGLGRAAQGTSGTAQEAASGTQRRAASATGLSDDKAGYTEPATTTTTTASTYSRGPSASYRQPRGSDVASTAGSLLASTLMILAGLFTFLAGLAAVVRRRFFTVPNHYAYHWGVHAWGWTLLILGVLLFAAGASLMLGMTWARIAGVALASLTAIAAFLFLPYSPIWAIVLIALSIFTIWALLHRHEGDESMGAGSGSGYGRSGSY